MRTAAFALAFATAFPAFAQPVIRVTVTPQAATAPVSGRLIVLLKSKASTLGDKAPLDGPFWEESQPIFGVDVKDLKPGAFAEITAAADAFPMSVDKLPEGEYEVQARLDTQRLDSEWRREPGNLYTSARATLTYKSPGKPTLDLTLDTVTAPEPREDAPGLNYVRVRSELLSKFRGHEVFLRAGVALPAKYDPAKRYPAVYEVPGFGGNDEGAEGIARRRQQRGSKLDESVFWIVLDPEGPNGHTLFADSANNGPCGEALIKELLPALERQFPLIAKPEARLLRGHSSGGWSTLWLATEYPETFGACWSSSPDPVDFRRFQALDIYADEEAYHVHSGLDGAISASRRTQIERLTMIPESLLPTNVPGGGEDIVSYRRDHKAIMTVQREARGEDLLGPDNTSAQQWDSWFAVWGPRNAAGNPQALWDPVSGTIDHTVAERYRRYDIADRLRKDPAKYAPIFRNNIRLVVGGADNFFLNEAVNLLKADLAAIKPDAATKPGPGFITIVPGLDHSSIFGSRAIKAFDAQMLEHLTAANLIP